MKPRLRTGFCLAILAMAMVLTSGPSPAAARSPVRTAASGNGLSSIDHIVVLMQENRSFDHYYAHLPGAQPLPPGASNPDPTNPSGPPITPFHQTSYCEVHDLDHSWNGTHKQWNGGKMDGFTATNAVPQDPKGSRAMGYYNETDLPYYYDLYSTFATGDRYFSSSLTQTFPNRFFLLAGTAFGHIRNDFPTPGGFAQRTIFNLLDEANPPISWKIYYSQIPFAFLFSYVREQHPEKAVPISQYFTDAAAGTLPQVAFVDPIFLGPANVENDEHPPANVQVGQKFVSDVIDALFHSPNWASSAFFLTYDEHGGYWDHVAPPPAPIPDGIPPMLQPGDTPGAFDRLGIRVPVVVVSPFAKRQFVSHVVHDHTSILRFIETRFDLPALTNRDGNADPMLEFFDFDGAAFQTPPALARAVVDPARAAACQLTAPPPGLF
jgi:phospholipase C